MDRIDSLSKKEIIAVRKLVEERWLNLHKAAILLKAKEARQEYEAGKTYAASTPEQIKQWFVDTVNNAD